MTDDIIVIKGVRDGLLITISPTEKWKDITNTLANRLDEREDFFAGATITLDVGERPVTRYELSSLKALLERRGMRLAVVQSSSVTAIESANALDLRTHVISTNGYESEDPDTLPIDPEEHGTAGVMIRRTLRSGRTVHSHGHVVVYGDVNPGAKIVAIGDIIIWGKLRGVAHAGAEGDTTAVVCALDMSPNQLRIAEFIVTSPKDKRRKVRPEVAYIRDGQIVVEAWN